MTLVSVVIPNYNGEATLDETLESVRRQTHAELEIIVVDDGSTDDSPAIVERHAAADPRLRLMRQANAGVAAARNTGWRAAASDIVAFVDSDDLWAPDKIERQLARMLAPDEPGLVYTGYASIDADSRQIERMPCPTHEGWVLDKLVLGNFIGNGSAALVRRWVLEATAGFESALHHAGAQGCEDLLFYCRAAEHCRFGSVADYLVGYRSLPDNMSSDGRRMLKSWLMVIDEIGGRHPDKRASLESGFGFFAAWTTRRSFFQRRWGMVWKIVLFLLPRRPRLALDLVARVLPRAAIGTVRRRINPPRRPSGPGATAPRRKPFLTDAQA